MATGFGAGLSPWAPGTVGSFFAALPLLLIPPQAWPWAPAAGAAVATALCVIISRRLPPKGQGGDPGWFVLDEVAGMWLSACALSTLTPGGLFVAFALFRAADILKPPPCRALERIGGGFGIVLDDLMAAGYALAFILALLAWGFL